MIYPFIWLFTAVIFALYAILYFLKLFFTFKNPKVTFNEFWENDWDWNHPKNAQRKKGSDCSFHDEYTPREYMLNIFSTRVFEYGEPKK